MSPNQRQIWEDYCQQELNNLRPVLLSLGFDLASEQPHLGGERYLSSLKKLVLLGRRISDQKKVMIKASSDPQGREEIEHERECRETLAKINFAYHAFLSPAEMLFTQSGGQLIFITEFIEQPLSFLQQNLTEQFFLSLKVFELQEGAQVATYEHAKNISRVFGWWQATDYLHQLDQYLAALKSLPAAEPEFNDILADARRLLAGNLEIIDLYGGFLTHWDLVPHNLRLSGHDIYLLDHSSLRFGNKYESWARLTNFMALYNPDLEKMLVDYVRINRGKEEFLAFKLMRLFRLIELIWHYAKTLLIAEGQVGILNKLRVKFWTAALKAVINDQAVSSQLIEQYKKDRDQLRDLGEKQRQKELH